MPEARPGRVARRAGRSGRFRGKLRGLPASVQCLRLYPCLRPHGLPGREQVEELRERVAN